MKKFLRAVKWPVGIFTAIVLLSCISVFLSETSKGNEALASWVQAVGSIAAIIGSLWVFRLQISLEETEKKKSILAIVEAADNLAKAVGNRIETTEDPDFYNIYDKSITQGLFDALNAIPAHELGSSAGVSSLILLKNHIVFLQNNLETYIKGPFADPEFSRIIENLKNDEQHKHTVLETIASKKRVLAKNVKTQVDCINKHRQILDGELNSTR